MDIPQDNLAKRRWLILGFAALIVIILIFALLSLRTSFASLFSEQTSGMIFKSVIRGDFTEQVSAYGTLKSAVRRSVVAKVSGTVTEIVKKPGTMVSRQDVLIRLANPKLDQEVNKAELDVKDAEATLAQTRADIAEHRLDLENNFAIAQSNAKAEKAQLTARVKLAKLNIISKLELMEYQASYDKAVLAEQLAKKRLDSVAAEEKAKLASATIKAQTAQEALAMARLNQASLKVTPGLAGRL